MRLVLLLAALAVAAVTATAARSTAPPVGKLPVGPVSQVRLAAGGTFTARLPKPPVEGGVWRIARSYDAKVVRETGEKTTAAGGVRVSFRAVAPGSTRVVYALTRGETAHALASRTFRMLVAGGGSARCPRDLLPLGANALGPSIEAALAGDVARNRPQVTAAALAPQDDRRGPQAKARCGATVWRRTVVVYVIDRALLPSQSLSQRVLFVGRTSEGYRVWQRAH